MIGKKDGENKEPKDPAEIQSEETAKEKSVDPAAVKDEVKQEDYKDKWLRALADYDNLKKRFEREKSELINFSIQMLIIDLFPIVDSFDSAMSSIEKSNDKDSFLKGLKILQSEFHKILEANGLKKIKTVGEKFDPNIHHAEGEDYDDRFPAGVVSEEIRSGYTLNERVLRPALVKVSKGPEKGGKQNG